MIFYGMHGFLGNQFHVTEETPCWNKNVCLSVCLSVIVSFADVFFVLRCHATLLCGEENGWAGTVVRKARFRRQTFHERNLIRINKINNNNDDDDDDNNNNYNNTTNNSNTTL